MKNEEKNILIAASVVAGVLTTMGANIILKNRKIKRLTKSNRVKSEIIQAFADWLSAPSLDEESKMAAAEKLMTDLEFIHITQQEDL